MRAQREGMVGATREHTYAYRARPARRQQRGSLNVAIAFAGVMLLQVALARILLWGSPGTLAGLLVDAAFVVLLAVPVLALSRGWATSLALMLSGVVSALLLTGVIYAAYFRALPTFDMLGLTGQLGEIRAGIADLWVPADWGFLLSFPALAALAAFAPQSSVRLRPALLAGVAVVAVAVVSASAISLAGDIRDVDSLQAARARGVAAYEFAWSLAVDRISEDDRIAAAASAEPSGASAAKDDLNTIIDTILGRSTAERIVPFERGVAKGKSVIFVQCEALQTLVVGQVVNGQRVTPNIDRLIATSWYLPAGISQITKGNTSDVEFSANSGIYPAMDKASCLAYGDRLIPGLPRLLSTAGYTTVTMHANRAGYWNRRNMYAALGFDRYYDRAFYKDEDRIGMGASDAAFFVKSAPLIQDLYRTGKPFYAYLVTLSTHMPFTSMPSDTRTLSLAPPYEGTQTGLYLQAMHYLDTELGRFLDTLAAEGILDDCVIVLAGDHFGLRPETADEADVEAQSKLAGRSYTYAEKLQVPIVIHLPGQLTSHVLEDPVGDVDIMPTLADLLGVDLTGVPQFGHSAFERGRTLLAERLHVPAGSYVTAEGVVIAGFGLDGAVGYPFLTRANLVPILQKDFDDAARLVKLADAYAQGLPRRSDAEADPSMYIPTKGGRGE